MKKGGPVTKCNVVRLIGLVGGSVEIRLSEVV